MLAPLRVIFMGTPEFAVPSLRALSENKDVAQIVAVFTQPDRPAGRGQQVKESPVKLFAKELGVPIHQPESVNAPEEIRKIADCMTDAIVVVAYAQFLGAAVLNTPRLGCINVHSSLLPKYRGAAPIQFAIWKGEKESGVTTMRLVKKMDAGPILLQKKIALTEGTTAEELHDQLAGLGAQAIVETLEGLRDSKLAETEQDESRATYASIIKKEDGLLDWSKSGIEISRQIRALNPWPGTYYRAARGVIKILKARLVPKLEKLGGAFQEEAGCIEVFGHRMFARCADCWVEVLELQAEGKRALPAAEFLNGLRSKEELKTAKTA